MASSDQPKDTEKRKVYDKTYRDNNKEKLNEKSKKYYHENKDKISEKIQCECGGVYRRDSKSQHLKTKMHNNFINGIEPKPVAEKYCICVRCNKMVDKHSEGMSRHMKRWPCVKAGMEGNPGRKEFYEWILNNKDNLLKDYEKHIKNAEAYFEKREEVEICVARHKYINDIIENSDNDYVHLEVMDFDKILFPTDDFGRISYENDPFVEYHMFYIKSMDTTKVTRWRIET